MTETVTPVPEFSARAFSYPAFRRYYAAAVLGTNGGWITRILLSWLAWDLTQSPSFVGIVAAASLIPIALFGPVFGALSDRMSVRVAYTRVVLAMLAVPILILGMVLLGALTPISLFAVALTFGMANSAYHPVRQSISPRLVERPAISSVVALAALNFNAGRLLAPAVGGLMIGAWGVVPTAVLGVLFALPNALVAPTLRPRENDPDAPHETLTKDLIEGFRVVWQRWPLRRSILLAVAALGVIRGMAEILPLVADGIFARGAQGLGLLTSSVGAGALVAAVFQVAAGERLLRERGLRFAIIAIGMAGVAGLVHVPTFELALVAGAMVGFASTYVGVSLQIGIQARLEDELRGRVMSIWMLSNTLSTSALALGISALSEWIGLTTAATICVVIASVAVIALWLWPTER